MFTLTTAVPAFQRKGGILTVRRRERHDEDILEIDGWLDGDVRAGRYCADDLRGTEPRLGTRG